MPQLLLDVFYRHRHTAHLVQKHFNLILNMRRLKSLHQFVCGKYDVWRYAAQDPEKFISAARFSVIFLPSPRNRSPQCR